MTTGVDKNSAASHTDIWTVLTRVESNHPDIATAALAREVDSLLGRKPAPTAPARPTEMRTPKRTRSAENSPFAWYQRVVAALPPVMSSEQAITAVRAVEAGLFAEERLDSLDRAIANPTFMRDLCLLIDEGRDAFRTLILSNLRLVFHWSKGVASSLGEDWAQDAFQAGCIGLIRGLQSWDYMKGYALSTYVSWHIRSQIQRWRWNETALIRLPVHVWEGMESKSGDLSATTTAAALQALNIVPIEDISEEDRSLFCDSTPEEVVERAAVNRIVSQLLDDLTEREAEVLKLRYGLGDKSDEPMTLDAIGQIYGLTRERIRQIESKAFKKLQEHRLRSEFIDLLYSS